jgi:uncharacterized protein
MNPILYLHGFASSPSSSKARYLRERLVKAGAQVEIPDLAAGDFEHLTITGQLAVIARAAARWDSPTRALAGPGLSTRRSRAFSLIGSSLGGYLAALYAARYPEISRVVLLAPAFDFTRRWREWLGPQKLAEWRSTGSMEVFHYGQNRNCALSYDLMEDSARYEPCPDFSQPALIFHGIHDDVVPAALSTQFASTHANARLELLDSGHELLNVLEYLGDRIVEFLAAPALQRPETASP